MSEIRFRNRLLLRSVGAAGGWVSAELGAAPGCSCQFSPRRLHTDQWFFFARLRFAEPVWAELQKFAQVSEFSSRCGALGKFRYILVPVLRKHCVRSPLQRHRMFCKLPVTRDYVYAGNVLIPKQNWDSFPLKKSRSFCFIKGWFTWCFCCKLNSCIALHCRNGITTGSLVKYTPKYLNVSCSCPTQKQNM